MATILPFPKRETEADSDPAVELADDFSIEHFTAELGEWLHELRAAGPREILWFELEFMRRFPQFAEWLENKWKD